ncbi:MAG: S8 family serine peptidase [Anaerolineae bacterium]
MNGKIARLLTLVMVLAMIASPVFASPLDSPVESTAQPPAANPEAAPVFQAADAAGPARYFVILSDPSVPSYTGGIAGYEATNPAAKGQARLDAQSPASRAYASYLAAQQAALVSEAAQLLGRSPEVVYQLQFALNAVVMVLDPAEAELVAKLPGVKQVERETIEQVETDYGPQWIGAPSIWNGTATGGLPGTKGEGVIIGVLDTGANMDHPSFADIGGDGYNHTNPFGSGVYKGLCASNPGQWVCNDKLVGYWVYTGETADDEDGHGSHTASTAGGNYLAPGTVTLGTYPYSPAISGVAPHANIIAYDVCTPSGCNSASMVAAMNQAILDGVHVINVSISISGNTWTGAQQQGYLSVFNAGITPVRSAGNSGPGASTIGSTPPWVVTVGANTHNRAGSNAVTNLSGGNTAPPGGGTLTGLGVSDSSVVASMVYAGNAPYNDALCLNPFTAGSVTGKIVICDRGTNARVAKGWNVLQGGAVGMVLVNTDPGQSLNGDLHHLPAVHLNSVDGAAIKAWVNSGTGHQGRIAGTTLSFAASNGDIMAGFSSRGPHPIANLLTPDVTNPGVDILAAYRSGAITPEVPSVEYAFVSGTSMSSPHTAGSAALIKALHPSWTPAEIKSALMNTGKYTGILKEDGVSPAIPFDMGTGRVDLTQAGNAGLLLNETGANFVAANPDTGGNPKALNLASLADAACATSCNWTRTVKATRAGTWSASYVTPAGMTLTATPSSFTLAAGQTQTLNITANVAGLPVNAYAFGYVVLTQGPIEGAVAGDVVHLTVVVQPISGQATINVTPSSLAATQAPNTTTNQALTIGNTGSSPLTWQIAEAPVAMRIELTAEGMDAPEAPVSLIVDDGGGENAIGLTNGGQFLWLNRFTPGAGNFPLQLQQVDVMFGYPAGGAGGVNVGELVDIYLYEDADGNPANGATFKGSLLNQAVEAVNGTTFSTYPLPAPVTFNGPGDVLIAVVNRTAGVAAGTFVAALDQTATQGRSWIGLGAGATTNPPTLPPATFGTVDSFGFPGNMMVRGYGEGAAACDTPADVPWLTVAPTGGTTNAGGSSNVNVGFNSTGLAVGTYNAVLCVTSNDPQTPLVEVPVTLTVEEQGGNMVEICRTPNVAIPDNNATGVSDTITVPDALTILDLDVYVRATHTWVGDVSFTLQHVETATTAALISRPGNPTSTFGCSGDNYDVTVNDEGPDTPIENQCGATAPAITGNAPGGDPPGPVLAAFDGQSTQGNWVLTATDAAAGDTGTLVEWCVRMTVPTAGGDPNIDVDPLSMASTQAPNTTTQQTLDVGNTGGTNLTWTIAEEPTAAPELADWSDNFDSYATGSQLHGQGGWKGWANDPAAGALTSGAQFRSSPNSAEILGATDLVHEYAETDGQWVYTAWQYVPTSFTGQSYFILLNSYDDAGATNNWSAQVMFDGGTNLVTNDGGVSGGSAALVKGQWVELRLELDLDADIGAFYYNGNLLYSGTWSGQVSGGGATTFAAVDLFANTGSVVYYDDMSLVSVSQPTVCSALSDIPWASVAPANGTTTPGGSTPVQVTFNSNSLAVGTYTGNLCIDSNDPDPGPGNGTDLVVVPLRLVVAGQPPNIDVDPLSMSSTQPANTTTQQMLNVANTGGGTLDWTIDEEDTTSFPTIVPGPQVAQPAAEVVGAPEGAAPKAASGPAALWQAPAAILYDNGPLVTNPGAGFGGADASALQSALALSTYGFGHAVSSGFRVADDFTVPAGPGWMVDSITFFAYQTGSTTTSTINAVNLRIWDGPPGQGGSNIVFGDTTTNRLSNTAFTNAYRVLDTALTGNTRPIMADTATVNTYLAPGTYWVDWQTGGTLGSGPWAPPVSILGQTAKPGSNGVQFDGAAWNPLLDTGAATVQDLPFVIEGTAGAADCVMLSDIPWLSLGATAGSNAGGTNTDVAVTFDSTGLAVGTYTGNLCVTSNDPDAGPGNGTELVVVPVELIVEQSEPGVFTCNVPAEGFENGVPPAGWSIQTNEPNGPQWSTIAGCGESGNFTNGTGDAACVSSDLFGSAEMDTSLVTPMFSLAGFGTASLTYTANYQNFAALDFLNVDISADGGATWTTLLSWNEDHGGFRVQPGENVSIDLSAYAGQSGLMLRYRYYDPNSGDWNWYAQVDNVALTCGQVGPEPNIDVDPLSMTSTQPTNTTTQQTLDVGNTGTADLTWMIEEEPVRSVEAQKAPSVSPTKLDAPTAVQRSAKELQDLLNSATADVVQDGSFEAGTPNPFWTEASTNFGTPLCDVLGCGTGTGTGPLTGGWWAWFGGIAAYEAGSVSQSVTIPSGGPATLSFWVEQFVCSGAAADYLEVNMDGTQLWVTTAADPACGTLGYRQVTVDVSAYADGGAHTLQFNSEVFGSANTNFFVDDVMLDGQTGPVVCDMPTDVPWLSVNPTNGTTAPAAITPVQVTFDSTGLAAGTYNANLCVTSNDPDAGPGNETELVIVPVELIVEETAFFSCEYPNENFEGGVPPMGWTVVNNVAGGPTWGDIASCGPNANGGNWTGGLGNAACISASTLTAGAYDAELRSPLFSLAGYSDSTISFLLNYQNWGGIDRLDFDISTDGGVTWAALRTYTTDQGAFQSTPGVFITTDLAPYLGQSNLMVRWRYHWDTPEALGWYAQIDEAEFKCTVAPPTAVTLDGLNATPAAAAGSLSLLALPAVVSLALGAAYALRRRQD